MDPIKKNDSGAAVEDVQHRLVKAGYLAEDQVTGTFGAETENAVLSLCRDCGIEPRAEVDNAVWTKLVDASFELGDRNLFLRVPFFHGADVRTLQEALSALGFSCGIADGIFGVHTEDALRRFQLNMGLPTDGIAGAYTYSAIRNLHHSWEGKEAVRGSSHLGFARAAGVLERHALCLFGTQEFTRSVASRMSNLALATNPASKIMSADSLLVAPDEQMLLVHIVLPEEQTGTTPRVVFEPEDALPTRLESALRAARLSNPSRVAVELPGSTWEDAGVGRSAQHFAITLLDALCTALAKQEQ